MNNINEIIHDLGSEETVISGCTTPGEIIITLQGLVEQNTSLKEKLERIEQIAKKDYCFSDEYHRAIKDIRNILEKE